MKHIAKLLAAVPVLFLALSCEKVDPIEPASDTTISTVLGNIQSYTNEENGDLGPSAQEIMNVLNEDGTFKDLNYEDHNSGNWNLANHTSRMQTMATAYVSPKSSLKGSDALYNAIVKCFTYWAEKNPEPANWWYSHIDTPQKVGLALCMLRSGSKQLPDGLEKALLDNFLTQPQKETYFTAANKQDIALGWIYLYTLQNDGANLAQAVKYYYEPLTAGTGDGIQHDYSYLIHGPQFYNLQYGSVALTTFPTVSAYLDDTSLQDKTAAEFIGEYVANGIIPLNRGKSKLFSAAGRMALSYTGNLQGAYSIPYTKLAKYMPAYADQFEAAAARVNGAQKADYKVDAYHRAYWRGDYTVHQRAEYTIGVRACSHDRVCKCEINTNGCNNLGYFISDGGTDICVDGEEYVEIFPVWKWDHVPGVTCPAGYSIAEFPHPTYAHIYPWGKFTGGVSDGKYGCSVYDLVDERAGVGSAAHKGYFFFDNEVVFLGNGVTSTNAYEIHTTVNQCNLDGEVSAETANGATVGTGSFTDLRWLCHDNVCYYFPENENVYVSAANQTGKWSDVNTGLGYTTEDVTRPVFLTYINHGTQPADGKYAYYVIPGKNSIAEGKTALDKIVYGNETDVQWVYNQTLDMLQAIFYKSCEITVDGTKVWASEPCALMVSGFKSGSTLSVADPSYSKSSIKVKVGSKTAEISLDTAKEYQGKTVQASL